MGNGIRDKKLRRVLHSSKVNCEALFLLISIRRKMPVAGSVGMEMAGEGFVRGNVNCGSVFCMEQEVL